MVVRKNGPLKDYLGEQDVRNQRLYVSMMAIKLSQFSAGAAYGTEALARRREIRYAFLKTLQGVPVRDESELLQVTAALVWSTQQQQEVGG